MKNILKVKGAPPQIKKIFVEYDWKIFNAEEAERDDDDWDLFWDITRPKSHELESIKDPNKFYNRIPGFGQLTLKNLLHKFLMKMEGKYGTEIFDFFPHGFLLPAEQEAFLTYLKGNHQKEVFICKPAGGCGGYHIELVTDAGAAIGQSQKEKDPLVVQKYIHNPKLIAGVKFDLRVYVLVSSINPLRIWVYNDGLTRFCAHKYQMNDLKDRYSHLTNTFVNQETVGCFSQETVEALAGLEAHFGKVDQDSPPKWDLKKFFEYMEREEGIPEKQIWDSIYRIVNLSIIPSILELKFRHACQSFEFMGYDLMMDDTNKMWLIEINSNPSIDLSFETDLRVKIPMIRSMINILTKGVNHQTLGELEGGFQLIYDSGSPSLSLPYQFFYDNPPEERELK